MCEMLIHGMGDCFSDGVNDLNRLLVQHGLQPGILKIIDVQLFNTETVQNQTLDLQNQELVLKLDLRKLDFIAIAETIAGDKVAYKLFTDQRGMFNIENIGTF